jgi:uncharacterized RDD family membrane protein YckC
MEKKIRRYLLKSPHMQAMWSRGLAKAIDFSLVIFLILLMGTLGKKFVGFAVVSLEDGGPCTVGQSFVRNLPFIIPTFFLFFPFIGLVISILVAGVFLVIEVYLLIKVRNGRRLGDFMADTSVVANDGHRLRSVRRSWYEAQKA